jgi:hypothetical protein
MLIKRISSSTVPDIRPTLVGHKTQTHMAKNCSMSFFGHFTPLSGKKQSHIAARDLTFSPHKPNKTKSQARDGVC